MAGAACGDSRCSTLTVAALTAALLWVLAQALSGRHHHPAWPRRSDIISGSGTGGAALRGYVVPRPRAFGNGTVFDFVLTANVRGGGDDGDGAAVYFVGPSRLRWHWTGFHCRFQVRAQNLSDIICSLVHRDAVLARGARQLHCAPTQQFDYSLGVMRPPCVGSLDASVASRCIKLQAAAAHVSTRHAGRSLPNLAG